MKIDRKGDFVDNKIKELSKKIVDYSINVQKGEKVLISIDSIETSYLVKCLVRDIATVGGVPFVKLVDSEINSVLLENTNEKRIEILKKQAKFEIDNYDSFINIRYHGNDYVDKNVPIETRKKIAAATQKYHDVKIDERKWTLLNYPSMTDAFKAKMSYDEFSEFAFNTMTVDYAKMDKDIEPLKKLMEKTDKVRLVAKNTDITFSIKGIPVIPCCGKNNIPDGEIFTAPVRDSINGVITYNTPSPYQGNIYNNVSLTFKDGKIVKATCDGDNDKLNEIFDTDEGARYVGEFAIGLNPLIKYPMGDILFDEKIIGSIHFTPGKCYEEAPNGNKSSIHWDMVLIQREDFGGGEIYFDDVLIRKNGLFVLPELEHLNYNLK